MQCARVDAEQVTLAQLLEKLRDGSNAKKYLWTQLQTNHF
jgi:DNA polymerase III psi subunit